MYRALTEKTTTTETRGSRPRKAAATEAATRLFIHWPMVREFLHFFLHFGPVGCELPI
jgi:hypothetical protein